ARDEDPPVVGYATKVGGDSSSTAALRITSTAAMTGSPSSFMGRSRSTTALPARTDGSRSAFFRGRGLENLDGEALLVGQIGHDDATILMAYEDEFGACLEEGADYSLNELVAFLCPEWPHRRCWYSSRDRCEEDGEEGECEEAAGRVVRKASRARG